MQEFENLKIENANQVFGGATSQWYFTKIEIPSASPKTNIGGGIMMDDKDTEKPTYHTMQDNDDNGSIYSGDSATVVIGRK